MKITTVITNNEDETFALGSQFAEQLELGDVVAFYGSLGAGKTEFIKGVCSFFNVEEIVTSPTFTIINQYTGKIKKNDFTLYHIDLYRIKDEKELEEIGFEECLNTNYSIKLIEWAEKAGSRLNSTNFIIRIAQTEKAEEQRIFHIEKNN